MRYPACTRVCHTQEISSIGHDNIQLTHIHIHIIACFITGSLDLLLLLLYYTIKEKDYQKKGVSIKVVKTDNLLPHT